MNFISKFNHSFTNRDCLHCAVLEALYDFKEKRVHKADRQEICNFFIQNVQKEIFNILEMFENYMKFTREACWINWKISSRDKNTTLMIFLLYHFCWSSLWWNYWRSLIMWNSNSWSRLRLTVKIQFALHPCDPFLINNYNMTGNSVEKQCFLVLN